MMILGELPSPGSYQAIGWLLVSVAAIVGGVNQLLKLVDRFKEKPPPGETYTTKEACRLLHAGQDSRLMKLECDVTTIRQELQSTFNTLNAEDERRASKIHQRIDTLVSAVGELRGEIKHMS